MTRPEGRGEEQAVGELLEAITNKLRANAPTVAKSLGYGRIIWRHTARGFEVDLEAKL